jgi:RecA/RadA recombinase
MIKELENEVKRLKIKIHREQNVEEKIRHTKELYTKKLELLDLIDQKDKSKNLGMTAREYLSYVKNLPNNPKYSTGIDKIDNNFGGGFESGMFINLAGQSFAGKTTLALNIIANIAQGRKTAWFNFEMGDRLMGRKLKDLSLTEQQLDNLYIECISNNLDNLLNEMSLLVEQGVKFFGIDSSMKIEGAKGAQEYLKLGDISNRLSKFCARKDATVIFINQMSEENIDAKKLKFKGSGNTIYDSDIALFLVLDAKENLPMEQRERFLICSKNRQNEKTFNVAISEREYKAQIVQEYTTDMPMVG